MKRIIFILLILGLVLLSCVPLPKVSNNPPPNIETNNPPTQPSNPSPNDRATNVSLNPTLSWDSSDPDGDTLTFDLYFGTDTTNLPLAATNLATNTYEPGKLDYSTTYYWKVVAKDSKGNTIIGPLWHFTTKDILKWKFFTGDNKCWSSPAIGLDGTVYFGCDFEKTDNGTTISGGNFYAMTPNGELKWKISISPMGYASAAIGKDGTVYVGTVGGLYAISPNGSIKWKISINTNYSSPSIGKDGTIYIGVYAINPDGSVKWKHYFKYENVFYTNPSIDSDGIIYIGGISESFYASLFAIDSNNSLKWSCETDNFGAIIRAHPSIGNCTIYFGAPDNYVYAINQSNGWLNWKFKTNGDVRLASPAIGTDGTIYVGSSDGYLYAIAYGTLKWKFKIKQNYSELSHMSNPAIDSNGVIYIGSTDGYLYAINPDGTLKWKYKTDSPIVSSPVIGTDGTLYIVSTEGYLYAFDTESEGVEDTPWPMFHHDAQHTGRSDYEGW